MLAFDVLTATLQASFVSNKGNDFKRCRNYVKLCLPEFLKYARYNVHDSWQCFVIINYSYLWNVPECS